MVTFTVHVPDGITEALQPVALKSSASLLRKPVTVSGALPMFITSAIAVPTDPMAGEPVLTSPLMLTKCRFLAVPSAK